MRTTCRPLPSRAAISVARVRGRSSGDNRSFASLATSHKASGIGGKSSINVVSVIFGISDSLVYVPIDIIAHLSMLFSYDRHNVQITTDRRVRTGKRRA